MAEGATDRSKASAVVAVRKAMGHSKAGAAEATDLQAMAPEAAVAVAVPKAMAVVGNKAMVGRKVPVEANKAMEEEAAGRSKGPEVGTAAEVLGVLEEGGTGPNRVPVVVVRRAIVEVEEAMALRRGLEVVSAGVLLAVVVVITVVAEANKATEVLVV